MRLSECLNRADISTLRSIADRYKLSCSRHSKMELIQELLFTLRDPSFLSQHVPLWQGGRERMMLRLCLEPRRALSLEELEVMFQASDTPSNVKDALKEGWLFATTGQNGRSLYCIPDEIHKYLRTSIIEGFRAGLSLSDEGPLLFEDQESAAIRDLDVFMEYVRHHDVRLTTDGCMYKRNISQILELLEVTEELVQGGWRFGYGRRFHDYPDRFALIYDFAYQQRLVEEQDDGTLSIGEGYAGWLNEDAQTKHRSIVRFYLSMYRRPITRLPQIAHIIAHVAVRWVRSDTMFHSLENLLNDYYYDQKPQVWQTRILKMMMHLGLIRLGLDENDEQWFQITKLGQQLLTPDAIANVEEEREKERILIVQPNFEIVVTADQPSVTGQLACFTELRQAGVVRVYRISEESVMKGLANGGDVSGWLDTVNDYAQTPVPGNVERTLLEWERQFRRTQGQASV